MIANSLSLVLLQTFYILFFKAELYHQGVIYLTDLVRHLGRCWRKLNTCQQNITGNFVRLIFFVAHFLSLGFAILLLYVILAFLVSISIRKKALRIILNISVLFSGFLFLEKAIVGTIPRPEEMKTETQ